MSTAAGVTTINMTPQAANGRTLSWRLASYGVYDPAGNRLTVTDGSTNFNYAANSQTYIDLRRRMSVIYFTTPMEI